MSRSEFVARYAHLGRRLSGWAGGMEKWPELDAAVDAGAQDNVFFTPWMQHRALEALADGFLRSDVLEKWLGQYPEPSASGKVCGVVAAGNIPAVAFQDILSVLAAGWTPVVKLSSKDIHLLPVLFPEVEFCNSTDGWKPDALLTMGGDAAADYFRTHFPGVPKLIRASRFSLAVVGGDEDRAALDALAEDMLLYYGLGCRSVTWLLVPEGYDMRPLMEAAERFARARLGRLAQDNHRRNRAVLTLSGEDFLDSGTVIFRPLSGNSPYGTSLHVGEVWYSEYRSHGDVDKFILCNKDRIQKIIRNFGTAQRPAVDDFPDGTDAVAFLNNIKV
ncbi:MAG TPA: hypothetical protein IAC04_07250 [Candidatus Coprenecus stercoravium]|uniref:Acyl-CoA reductase n=1 Tax=Candidatus Coprenecus stercoravium TaxID=2840735 RepID=A0A9D2KBG6_9BACT|nr:hypothetical protein [Candidatus Coprenecus stercoravium]